MRCVWLVPLLLVAQDGPPAQAPAVKAEWMGRSLLSSMLSSAQNVTLNDYIAVEVTITPAPQTTAHLSNGDFQLRVNGRKQTLNPVTAEMVAAAIKYPDWETRPSVQADAGAGGGGVILGRTRPTERFPGDPNGRQARLPRVPGQDDRSGMENAPPMPAHESVTDEPLPEYIA